MVALYRDHRQAEADCATARELLADPEMRELGELELSAGEARIEALEAEQIGRASCRERVLPTV